MRTKEERPEKDPIIARKKKIAGIKKRAKRKIKNQKAKRKERHESGGQCGLHPELILNEGRCDLTVGVGEASAQKSGERAEKATGRGTMRDKLDEAHPLLPQFWKIALGGLEAKTSNERGEREKKKKGERGRSDRGSQPTTPDSIVSFSSRLRLPRH